MQGNAFGIDLGTSEIKIYSLSDDSILIEKNMIAIENKKNVFAYGNSAYEMFEKAPSNIQISHPLTCGAAHQAFHFLYFQRQSQACGFLHRRSH